MKSVDFVAKLKSAEADILKEAGPIIESRINELAKDAGRNVTGIEIYINDVTPISSEEKRKIVSRVTIDLED